MKRKGFFKHQKLNNCVFLLTILSLIPLYIILYKIYIPRVNAFGCFDDCFNIIAGYFVSKGKTLYSEIFFNHQMLMAYISYFIQSVLRPINIYELILQHRQFMLLFGFIMNTLIVWRFKLAGAGFVLFYEFSKFYLFGDRFLAEGLVVYPLVYMVGNVWYKLQNKKIYFFEYLLDAVFVWFIIFMREPFSPLSLFMATLIVWGRPFYTVKKIAIAVFLFLAGITLFQTPLDDYLFNVVTVNYNTFLTQGHLGSLSISYLLKVFFYPIFLFFGGEWNVFRHVMVILSSVFLLLFIYFIFVVKRFKLASIILIVLALANLRVVTPGRIFYDAFHLLPWYGLFITVLFLMLKDFYIYKKKIALFLITVLFILFSYLIVSPSSYIHDKIDAHAEFITNFGKELQVGEVIKALSEPTDTVFLDGADDLIYWQAGRMSPYKYSWYTSVMPGFSLYSQARMEMFDTYPPEFYYRFCSEKEIPSLSLPIDKRKDYQQLYSAGKPTCLYIKKTKIPEISNISWQKALDFLYELPKEAYQ